MTSITGYAWACLSVRNLDRSVGWYRTVFGLDVLMSIADTCAIDRQDRFVYLIDATSLFVVGLQQSADNDPEPFRATVTGLDHVSLAVAPAGLRQWQQWLRQAGVPFAGPIHWQAGTLLELTDPDGIPVRLFELSTSD